MAGIDLFVGMLEASRRAAPLAQFAVAHAIRTDAAALALAMHMLYHVPDPARAVTTNRGPFPANARRG